MPRFVILAHDWPFPHWDLLLEFGPVLKAWRLSEWPTPGSTQMAERIADHRLFYLDYEGPVTGNRGTVKRCDAGEYRLLEECEERLVLSIAGTRWSGVLELQQRVR